MADIAFLITAALITGTIWTELPLISIVMASVIAIWIGHTLIITKDITNALLKVVLVTSIGLLAWSHISHKLPKVQYDTSSSLHHITATLTAEPEKGPITTTCQALMTWPEKAPIIIRWQSSLQLEYGNTLTVRGHFMDLQSPRNPGQFNQKDYLRKKGLFGQFKVTHFDQITPTKGVFIKRLAIMIRKKIHALHYRTLESPYIELYIGLIFGDAGINLPRDIKSLFKATGLTHLIVVSGSQVALLVGILLRILKGINASPKPTFIIVSFFNLLFFFITGGEASIFRAILMAEIALLVQLLNRKTPILYTISLTVSLMIIINPLVIFDLGAYLSFAATLSLIFIAPQIEPLLPVPKWLKPYLSVTLAPFICTLPIVWHLSNQISFVSIITNLMMISWIECVVVIGFASTLLGSIFPFLAELLNNFCWLAIKVMLAILPFFKELPGLTLSMPHLPILIPILISAALINAIMQYKNDSKYKHYWGALVMISISTLLITIALLPKPFKVTFLDVDQGDATLLETPTNHTILIDVGKNHADSVLIPALAYKGIDHIDIVILTHFDSDHYGSLARLMTEVPITTIIDNGNGLKKWPDYHELLKKYGINRLEAKENTQLHLSNGDITFLGPQLNRNRDELSENNQSLQLKLAVFNTTFLFTGDLEEPEEYSLISAHWPQLDIDILKLGHHGSKTSTTQALLDTTTPKYAIISAGRKNRYGHPATEVIDRVKALNIPILNTQYTGAIEISLRPEKSIWKTFLN
jgi:competence protein ComEC